MNFIAKLVSFFHATQTTDTAIASLNASFAKLDKAVEEHARRAAQAAADRGHYSKLALAAAVTAAAEEADGQRAQRIKLRIAELLA